MQNVTFRITIYYVNHQRGGRFRPSRFVFEGINFDL